jgi:mono/diheme cytochrome c family protein
MVALWAEPGRATDGEALYTEYECAGCHEVAVVPGQTVFRLDGLAKRHSVDTLVAYLADPRPPMPRFDLSDEERRTLARHLLSKYP